MSSALDWDDADDRNFRIGLKDPAHATEDSLTAGAQSR